MFRRPRSSETAYFTALALAIMIVVKVFVVDGIDAYRKPKVQSPPVVIYTDAPIEPIEEMPLTATKAPEVKDIPYFDFSGDIPQPDAFMPPVVDDSLAKAPQTNSSVAVEEESRGTPDPPLVVRNRPKLVIIIDDMGLARGYTQDIIDLPPPLTLAFLPYAERLEEFTIPAQEKGHELIIHVPMEPMNPDLDLGPHGLRTNMQEENFKAVMRNHIFSAFGGYVGINNHMGSRLTQDTQAMGWVMEELGERGLFFVDSKTIAGSIAAKTAGQYDVPFAERDVFLDHYNTIEAVREALHELELVAMREGVGIAIGHPKAHTVRALKEWIPDAAARGFEFVPVSAVIQKPAASLSTAPVATFKKQEALKALNLSPVSPVPGFSPYSDY